MNLSATQFEALEWGYISLKAYADPFNEIELDAILTHDSGQSWRVPAYWSGGQEWRVRFAPPLPGKYQVSLDCTDRAALFDNAFDPVVVQASLYQGGNPLLCHGPIQVAKSRRTLEFQDGTPFFWLADTWWMSLCNRLDWPDGFQRLAADRVAKGFTTIMIVAGLYPDMPGFDPRGANEAGFPWEPDYQRINPAYFDMADLRIRWLVHSGLTPSIVGCWGYYLPLMGIEKVKKHWRYMMARWSAYPVVWCLVGEALMPYYLSEDKAGDEKLQKDGWTELAHYVRSIDPYHRLLTIHSVERETFPYDGLVDINLFQTVHDGYPTVAATITRVRQEYQHAPVMPVLVGEANYEGILHNCGAEVQRLIFWSSILSGACGHTYGANGLWQLNNLGRPYGASPWGGTWGGPSWYNASQQPGSAQLGLAKKLLERYEWWRFEPHQDWVKPGGNPENMDLPFAAGIPGQVRLIYFYMPTYQKPKPQYHVCGFEAGVRYRGFFWDPRSGEEHDLGEIHPDKNGEWSIPMQPELKDWVVVLERI